MTHRRALERDMNAMCFRDKYFSGRRMVTNLHETCLTRCTVHPWVAYEV